MNDTEVAADGAETGLPFRVFRQFSLAAGESPGAPIKKADDLVRDAAGLGTVILGMLWGIGGETAYSLFVIHFFAIGHRCHYFVENPTFFW
ncbi:hypothetical protein ACF3MZ_30710 [Paenibacillaceae bacterium WGS1546]|uniref:hypothetical protein n=1 Tax=Cohnella sp. WGS1546 TaxID=3366810 RepID=UPI00372D532C